LIAFPNCKINLGLHVVKKRADGYHDIETIFYPLPFYDVVEIITSSKETSFQTTGLSIGELNGDNLCIKAYQLLKKDYPNLPHVKIHLHKAIPIGAGLGGGSADAAFTLTLLNQEYQLGISSEELEKYAAILGSDCPFFIANEPALALGRGEILKKVSLNLKGYHLLLVKPSISINTATAFSKIKPQIPSQKIEDIIQLPISEWQQYLVNDFEKVIFEIHPNISKIKGKLYQNGAIYAAMSGTGSTIFGIFHQEEKIDFMDENLEIEKWIAL
jgi:4-diphosphocytidyl-2-C-methyl-D-erythritol kinase